MRIAFYAPMKSPNHPVPSGDRQMARLLIKALQHAGHTVELASELRSYCAEPGDRHYDRVEGEATREIDRLCRKWTSTRPDLWFTYHPYYKAPDPLGPRIAQVLQIPYVTAEASYSARRNVGRWANTQAAVADAVRLAAANICFTERDRLGLEQALPDARLERLQPFIDVAEDRRAKAVPGNRLISVAMMRPGDKMESYRMLARALERLADQPWTLSIIGDGPGRPEVEAAFAALPGDRIEWLGELAHPDVTAALSKADVYVWPGFGEAFGLAYLEAQAAGLPTIAQQIAGVPEVVRDAETGILTPAADIDAYADAIRRLLLDADLRDRMGEAASRFVREERSLPAAAVRLDQILQKALSWIDNHWAPLREELGRWADAGRRPIFWLRDDDAVEPTPALDRLLDVTERFGVPLVLASIPAYATQSLADCLAANSLVSVAVHGWSHTNHAQDGQKKQELGPHRPENELLAELRQGIDRIGQLFGRQSLPLLVPPWNRIAAALLPALPSLGFRALSVYGPAKSTLLPMINSTVDIMDWHGTRSCLPTPVLVEMIVAQLRASFTSGEAIGLLTHHLVHDEAAWIFLEQLFELTTADAQWLGFDALMARASATDALFR